MNARRLVISLLAVGCLVGAWFAWRLESQIAHFRVRVESDRKSAIEQKLAETKQAETDLYRTLAQLHPGATQGSSDASGDSDQPAIDPKARQRALIEFAKLWMGQNAVPMYQHLARSLGLNDAQIAQLSDLSAERLVVAWSAMSPILKNSAGGDRPDQATLQQAVTSATAGVEGQMHQLLGDSGYQQFQQQVQLAPEEGLVQQMGQYLVGQPGELSDSQKDQLAQILAQNQPASTPSGPLAIMTALGGNSTPQITDAALAQAANILSPDQLAAMRQYQADVQAKKVVIQIYRQVFRQQAQGQGQSDGQN